MAQAATGEHKEKPGFGGKGGAGGDRGGSIRKSQVRIRISQDRIRRATHSIRKNTMPIYGEISSIRGEPMSIRNQPCPRRDGGMEVDGDMEVGSIKIKTLSIKINTQPGKMPVKELELRAAGSYIRVLSRPRCRFKGRRVLVCSSRCFLDDRFAPKNLPLQFLVCFKPPLCQHIQSSCHIPAAIPLHLNEHPESLL